MSTINDLKYIGFLSTRLRNFKQLKPRLFKFSHSCEDQTTNKARTYLYEKNNSVNVFCHHCGYSTTFHSFLKETDNSLFEEYQLEKLKESSSYTPQPIKQKPPEPVIVSDEPKIIFFDQVKQDNPALQYLIKRKIPKQYWNRLGYVADFNKFASVYNDNFKPGKVKTPRLVLPFYDRDESVFCYSARAFGREQPKYIKLTVDPNKEKIYGLWRINESQPIVVCEGQFDSLFIDNAVAVSGADYSGDWIQSRKNNIIILPDNDYKRNPQVYKLLEKSVNAGFKIAFLPETIPWKDINDCIVKGNMSQVELNQLIHTNTKTGLAAKLELVQRRKF